MNIAIHRELARQADYDAETIKGIYDYWSRFTEENPEYREGFSDDFSGFRVALPEQLHALAGSIAKCDKPI